MAAKRARPTDKKSLVRQDIANRRRAIQEKKLSTSSTGRRAILGVFVLAVSLLALVAVGSFSAQDRVGPGYQNAVGPVGHGIAEALRGLLGICAYVLPLAGLYGAMVMFVGAREKTRWPQVLAAALLCVSTAVLAQLFWGAEPGWSHPPGGLIGVGLGNELSGLFSTVGTVILVTAVSVAALIVGMQQLFLRLCAAGWSVAQSAGAAARTQGALFMERQKQAMVVRREAAAQAKLEEAAFLAQLEADEEELAAAEREAAEADAMAEEAMRLTREAEQKAEAAKAPKKPLLEKQPLSSPALPARLPRAAPVELPALPSGDPAWASSLLPAPAAAAAALAPAPEAPEPPRKRKQPQIIAAPQASTPPIPAVELTPAIAPAMVSAAPVSLPPPSVVKEPAPAPTALARMPLIVEPKAPPKPTKKVQEQFHFVGDRKSFTLPPLDVLEFEKAERTALDKDVFLATAEKLRAKLADFGIVGEVVEIRPGPVVTMYEFLPGPGIKVSKIASLQDDLAMAMEAMRVRIVAPIPGKGVVGIEVPNRDRETVFLKEIVEQDIFQKASSKLTMSVGKDIEGMPYLLDLAKAPHILMAGTTGSGKSVAVNSMIMSILLKATPEEVRFIMVDPKMLELSVYEGIPHLLLPVVTDPKKAALALRWAVEEMERRYHLLSEAGVRNIAGYNKLVESAQGAAKELLRAPGSQVVEAKAAAPAAEPKKPAAKKKLLIVDVAQGETEDEALARASAANDFGVPAPREELEDAREPLPEEEPVLAASEAPAAEEEEEDAPLPELAAAPSGEEEEPGEKEKPELKKLPYIVVIIDELADLMMVASREVETYVARLAQMARASGIHLMVATQRPSTDVVTGVIKANFPTRISFMLRSKPDSMTILGTVGAEALLGMGDMLIMPPTSSHMQRVHGAYVSEEEIKRAVDHLKAQGKPVYDESILKAREEDSEGGGEEDELSDDLYDQALATVSEMRQVSISMLQRKMRIGYNRAARMIERMEREGVVGPADGAKPREVLLRPVGEMPGAGAM